MESHDERVRRFNSTSKRVWGEVPDGVFKRDGRWIRPCPKCGVEVSHARKNYCVNAHLIEQLCKRCSNINNNNNPMGLVGPVRQSWYNAFKTSAITRGYNWCLTIEQVGELWASQGGRCALTGWDIKWASHGHAPNGPETTASIDRIDSDGDYTLDNIQLVHKWVNMAKGTMSQDDFIAMCRAVSDAS